MKIILADLNNDLIEAWNEIGSEIDVVSTCNGSIFDVQCDAIVSPANSFGFMDGGIDMAISNFFGWHIQDRLQHIIQTKHHGELLVGVADIVKTDNEQIPYIISAPTMRIPMILRDTPNVYLAIRGLLLLVKYGFFEDGSPIIDKVITIAIPGMGTGIGEVAPKIFARQMKKAIEEVLEEKECFPGSWWEASQQHQLLYSDSYRDLQN